MRHPSRWRLPAGIGVVTGALVLSVLGLAAPALAGTGTQTAPSGIVSNSPAAGTPELAHTKGSPFQEINVLQQCGNTIYAGGTFGTITQGSNTYTRYNLFAFSATAPYTVSSWAPDVNGNVQTLTFAGGNCSDVYIGGKFTKVGSTSVSNLAEVSTTTGQVNTAFGDQANGDVDTMAVFGTHILTGGEFTDINGSSSDPYYSSLNTTTGKNDGYLDLHISGHYSYSGVADNNTKIYSQQLSHAGGRVMVEGDFTSAGGQSRQQVFQLWLNTKGPAVVTAWNAPILNTHCAVSEPFYAQDAAWSPSDNEVYVATTGDHVYKWNDTWPLPQPCDMALAFSANETTVSTAWANPTGCDSLLSVISDDNAVYFAGHNRYTNNAYACNQLGKGGLEDYGMQGLNPTNGYVYMNPENPTTEPEYTMSRANGQYMLLTTGGLWIGSTNRFGDDSCNNVSNLAGICYLPYSS